MLMEWQRKFPQCFESNQSLFTELTFDEQERLSCLLTTVEEHGLLNEETVSCILSLSAETRAFSLSMSDPYHSIQFILRAGAAKVDAAVAMHFLSQRVAMSGLSRAITLYDFSHFDYREVNFPTFSALATVLAIPLCQTIFDARLRSCALFSMPSEPLNASVADGIIHQLIALRDEELKICVFFDYFAQFRPFPESQTYIVEDAVATEVTEALASYCASRIHAIENAEDYIQVRQMIKTLRTTGGDKALFEQIKYAVANAVVSRDWCSTQSYMNLMAEIWQALKKPQVDLEQFSEQLLSSKGSQQMATAAMKGRALLMSSSSRDEDSEEAAMEINRAAFL